MSLPQRTPIIPSWTTKALLELLAIIEFLDLTFRDPYKQTIDSFEEQHSHTSNSCAHESSGSVKDSAKCNTTDWALSNNSTTSNLSSRTTCSMAGSAGNISVIKEGRSINHKTNCRIADRAISSSMRTLCECPPNSSVGGDAAPGANTFCTLPRAGRHCKKELTPKLVHHDSVEDLMLNMSIGGEHSVLNVSNCRNSHRGLDHGPKAESRITQPQQQQQPDTQSYSEVSLSSNGCSVKGAAATPNGSNSFTSHLKAVSSTNISHIEHFLHNNDSNAMYVSGDDVRRRKKKRRLMAEAFGSSEQHINNSENIKALNQTAGNYNLFCQTDNVPDFNQRDCKVYPKMVSSSSDQFSSISPWNASATQPVLLRASDIDNVSLPPDSCFETAFTSDSPKTRIIPQKSVDTLHLRQLKRRRRINTEGTLSSLRPRSIAVPNLISTSVSLDHEHQRPVSSVGFRTSPWVAEEDMLQRSESHSHFLQPFNDLNKGWSARSLDAQSPYCRPLSVTDLQTDCDERIGSDLKRVNEASKLRNDRTSNNMPDADSVGTEHRTLLDNAFVDVGSNDFDKATYGSNKENILKGFNLVSRVRDSIRRKKTKDSNNSRVKRSAQRRSPQPVNQISSSERDLYTAVNYTDNGTHVAKIVNTEQGHKVHQRNIHTLQQLRNISNPGAIRNLSITPNENMSHFPETSKMTVNCVGTAALNHASVISGAYKQRQLSYEQLGRNNISTNNSQEANAALHMRQGSAVPHIKPALLPPSCKIIASDKEQNTEHSMFCTTKPSHMSAFCTDNQQSQPSLFSTVSDSPYALQHHKRHPSSSSLSHTPVGCLSHAISSGSVAAESTPLPIPRQSVTGSCNTSLSSLYTTALACYDESDPQPMSVTELITLKDAHTNIAAESCDQGLYGTGKKM